LDAVAKKAGVNLAKMKTEMESKKVTDLIAADIAEANSFGIQGTPGFVVSGVSIRGAYPIDTFKSIIDRKLKGQ
jgi:protein-disulfide isomerase